MSEGYGLNAKFEQWCAELAACKPSFWGRAGHEVDPDRITDPDARLVFEACRAIATDSRPPAHPRLVLQRIQAWHQAGRVDADQLAGAADLLDAAEEDADGFDEDAVVHELAPILKKHVRKAAFEEGVQAFAKGGDLGKMESLLTRAKRIGDADISIGSKLSAAALPAIIAATITQRLSLGIEELDAETNGGAKRATLTVVTGGPKSGKSMFIDHQTANCIASAIPSAIATLELEEVDHHARIVGNLTDLDYDDILNYQDIQEESVKRMQVLEEDGLLSFCTVKWFPQHATTVADIEAWLDAEEAMHGVRIKYLGVDYYQLLAGEKKAARHEELNEVAASLFNLAKKRDMWITTGNQASGQGMDTKKTKVLDNQHSGESKGITRTCDLHITLNNRDDMESILWHVAGNRYGPTGGSVGPLPVEFEKGRVAPAVRRGWPY